MDMSIPTNVFLDLGSHQFEGLHQFSTQILPIDKTWEIHCFEPNPKINLTQKLQTPPFKDLNISLYNKAVWIHNGTLTFKLYGDSGLSQGSLLEETKGDLSYGDYHSSTTVECIDLYEFITKFHSESNLYIKMDIEWAEYTILPTMLEKGWPSNIKKIWVEFHGKHEKQWSDKAQQLINDISNKTSTEIESWI
jgi:FkbM family methyltransferase